jgi:hypothetical protein
MAEEDHNTLILDVARRVTLGCILHKDAGSPIEALREQLIYRHVPEYEQRFAQHKLSPDMLLGVGYTSICYVWNILRKDQNTPVSVEQMWRKLVEHFDDDSSAHNYLTDPLPLRLNGEQEALIADFLDSLERSITEWVSVPAGLEVLSAWIPREHDTVRYLSGDGVSIYSTDIPHPLTALLTEPGYPLPRWQVQYSDGYFLAVLVPASLYKIVVAYFQARDLSFDRVPFPMVVPELDTDQHAQINIELALAFAHTVDGTSPYQNLAGGAAIVRTRLEAISR